MALQSLQLGGTFNADDLVQLRLPAVAGTLHTLLLCSCCLQQVPQQLSALIQPTALDLSYNPLYSSPEAAASTWQHLALLQRQLRRLILEDCELPALPPVLSTLTALTELDLSWNALGTADDADTDWQPLTALIGLQVLDLRDCALRHLPAVVGSLAALTELSLSHNDNKARQQRAWQRQRQPGTPGKSGAAAQPQVV